MEQWKIVVLDGKRIFSDDVLLDGLRKYGVLSYFSSTSDTEIVDHISDNNIVLVDEVPITRNIIERCPSIKMVEVLSTGYNHVDIDAAQENGILVCNVPGYSASAVAQLTTALLLEIYNNVGQYNTAVHSGKWKDDSCCNDLYHSNTEIAGKKVGIIGFGNIGRLFGQIVDAMGAEVLIYSRHQPSVLKKPSMRYVTLDELLSESDVVSLHCPLNEDTFELINAATIRKMKTGAILINTARGALLNERDVIDALFTGKLRALGQDTFVDEPIPEKSPLLRAPNAYLTPHVGWNTMEAKQKLIKIAIENIKCFIDKRPQNMLTQIPE